MIRSRYPLKPRRAIAKAEKINDEPTMTIHLKINGADRSVDVDPQTPLLWVLRDALGLTGATYGCDISMCGACTIHIAGKAVRACSLPVAAAAGQEIVTIEGLAPDGGHPLQRAWTQFQVPQCGYCMSGMIMAAAALLNEIPRPSDRDIDDAIDNICRCGTYARVRQAIHHAAGSVS